MGSGPRGDCILHGFYIFIVRIVYSIIVSVSELSGWYVIALSESLWRPYGEY